MDGLLRAASCGITRQRYRADFSQTTADAVVHQLDHPTTLRPARTRLRGLATVAAATSPASKSFASAADPPRVHVRKPTLVPRDPPLCTVGQQRSLADHEAPPAVPTAPPAPSAGLAESTPRSMPRQQGAL